jgi:predicted tellurium resistance membrane protein TerC
MDWIGWVAEPEAWIALATLTALEIVLGVDNIVFISILAARLPAEEQGRARKIGLLLALVGRLALLFSIAWLMGLTATLFELLGQEISWRDLILIGGGLFLIAKSTHEIHSDIEGEDGADERGARASFGAVLAQILLLDVVFSLDSVITAVGMARQVPVMALAILIAIGFMILSAARISDFIHRHPTVKMLALAFLIMVGIALIADGLEVHIPRGYVYFAMAFSLLVEVLNLRIRRARAARSS